MGVEESQNEGTGSSNLDGGQEPKGREIEDENEGWTRKQWAGLSVFILVVAAGASVGYWVLQDDGYPRDYMVQNGSEPAGFIAPRDLNESLPADMVVESGNPAKLTEGYLENEFSLGYSDRVPENGWFQVLAHENGTIFYTFALQYADESVARDVVRSTDCEDFTEESEGDIATGFTIPESAMSSILRDDSRVVYIIGTGYKFAGLEEQMDRLEEHLVAQKPSLYNLC